MSRLGSFSENTIVVGDCLDIMAQMPDGCVDLVVTDPPYSMSVVSARANKINRWADISNASHWYSAWYKEIRRILKAQGAMWAFCNWRSIPIVVKSAYDARWWIDSVLVWDKDWIGIGGSNRGLRHSYELVALLARKEFQLTDRGIPDIVKFKWSSRKPTGHPAEKPEELIQWLLEISKRDFIFDPFMGSGTTAVVADRLGRNFFGCDINPDYVEMALKRLEKDRAGRQLALL